MLSNLIDKASVAQRLGYSKDEVLKSDNLGVYIFKYKNKRTKKVNMDSIAVSDTGFSVPSIDEAIERQNKLAEELFYLLKYSTNDEEDSNL